MKPFGVMTKAVLPVVVGMLLCSGATAATVTVGNATAPVGGGATTPTNIGFAYTADADTTGFECSVNTPAGVTLTSVTATSPLANCVVTGAGNLYITVLNSVLSPLPSNTSYCNLEYTVGAGAVAGNTFTLTPTGCLYTNAASMPSAGPHTENAGTITVTAGPPPDVVVTFTPASGSTIAFGGGAPGANVTQSIALGNTGTIGSGTVSGCVLSGADAGLFSITGGNPSTVPPATSIGLQATLGAAALSATLTCNVADASATTSVTWPLTAPAGTVLQAPTLASNPASGASITLPNSYGTPVTTPIAFTPTGGDAGGPNASVTCSTASAGFTVTPAGALTFTPPGGAAQNAVVGCTPGASPVAGVVTCTGTHQGGAINWSYDVTCPAAQTAPPPPTFVPATSLWSKLALFGVFAALGMLVLGLRRNH